MSDPVSLTISVIGNMLTATYILVRLSDMTAEKCWRAIILNAVFFGGLWGWLIPETYRSVQNIWVNLFVFLSLFWLSFVLGFRATDNRRYLIYAACSASAIYIAFLLSGTFVYYKDWNVFAIRVIYAFGIWSSVQQFQERLITVFITLPILGVIVGLGGIGFRWPYALISPILENAYAVIRSLTEREDEQADQLDQQDQQDQTELEV